MDITAFISNFKNYPVLFIGTGFSLRYLEHSFRWDDLLAYISYMMTGNDEHYLDIKSKHSNGNDYNLDEVAQVLETEFNELLEKPEERHGKFEKINDDFYKYMRDNINISRFKIYLSKIFSDLSMKENIQAEIVSLTKARKNISSIVTTNYDRLAEKLFDFSPLIGNDILLSNPYGSLYKIHGCVTRPDKIIITTDDYKNFESKYELIRAQLISLFVHNPIIFLGYSVGDRNIKDILKTIFTYVDFNTPLADKIRSNFLLVEYDKGSTNKEVTEHDIVLNDITTIRINKIKTDDYISIYEAISNLQLPISTMDIRKVQNIVKEIYSGGDIKVSITEDINSLDNKDKVLVIGSKNTIKYEFRTIKEMMIEYFSIIEEENVQLLKIINKQRIQSNQYFPVFGFSKLTNEIENIDELKDIQVNKLKQMQKIKCQHTSIEDIVNDESIARSNKVTSIATAVLNNQIKLEDVEDYLKNYENKNTTDYRKLLCAYDYIKYNC